MRPMIKYIKDNFDYPLIGAEVGVGLGNHAAQMVEHLDLQKLYLIDHWQEYRENGLLIKTYAGKADMIREMFQAYRFVEVVASSSLDAVRLFDDGYFDFIYIDANPSYETTWQNINAWWDKVGTGGVIGGNNQKWAETWQAVQDKTAGLIASEIFIDGNEWWVVIDR